jgi:type III restriction enzyme
MPDARAFTIWDIIQNTIEHPDLTLYLVLDEAHRGMGETKAKNGDSKPTIVKQLINGTGAVPGIPIVWGISATVDRFNKAMEGAKGRDTLSNVVVDTKKVQDSGLIKDVIVLDVPDEDKGEFSTVLLRRGTNKLKAISEAWDTYSKVQGEAATVVPLMVLQVPNSPDHNEIGKAIETIFETWPDLHPGNVANVFGEHKTEAFGSYSVPYIEPQRVQESKEIRILIAKDAISTGWDCPRAEVMVSFRAATDKTHITQLLGRMVRTPLARRIPGNDRLNSVDCLLPRFNKKTAEEVVDYLTKGGEFGEEAATGRVLINPVDLKPNPAIPEDIWNKLLSLPSQTLPKRQSRPVKRLTILAHELAADGLLPGAGKKAHAALHKVLDSARAEYAEDIKKARQSVLEVEGKSVKTNMQTGKKTFDDFLEAADYAVIEDAYKRAGRVFSPDVARTYADHIAAQAEESDDDDEALIDARTTIASLGLVSAIAKELDAEAEKLANEWLTQHKDAIKILTDERQESYRQIREMSAHPLDVELARPNAWMQPTTVREANGAERDLPRFKKHLLCDGDGEFPFDYGSSWEETVLLAELQREDNVAWYRNPDRAAQESLGVTYEDGDEMKIVRPDFIFFSRLEDGSIVSDIVDPHGIHLADALPKLRGLARYAEENAGSYRRIEAVAKIDEKYRVLDLRKEQVRTAIHAADRRRSSI